MTHEKRHKGEPSAFLPATAFVAFMQNHDQVGSRPYGKRISALLPDRALRMWSAITLLSPHIPLLFMGEEWRASAPFIFFSDVGEDLAGIVREGRLETLKNYPEAEDGPLPDPMSQAVFEASKLDWSERLQVEHAEMLQHYQELVRLRKREIIPRLPDMPGHGGRYEVLSDKVVRVEWRLGDGSRLSLLANLGSQAADHMPAVEGRQLWLEGSIEGQGIGPWSALFQLIPGS